MDNKSVLNIKDQDENQSVNMLHDLMACCHGKEFDGFTAARFFLETWGVYADHHIYTSIMDMMTRSKEAVCTQGYGTTKYKIN